MLPAFAKMSSHLQSQLLSDRKYLALLSQRSDRNVRTVRYDALRQTRGVGAVSSGGRFLVGKKKLSSNAIFFC